MTIETSWPQLIPQKIRNWGGWPDDVEDTIRKWNKSKNLTFKYGWWWEGYRQARGPSINGIPYFTCDECQRFIQIRGADRCCFRGKEFCEDCLIELARKENTSAEAHGADPRHD